MRPWVLLLAATLLPNLASAQAQSAAPAKAPQQAGTPLAQASDKADKDKAGASDDDKKKEARKERRAHRKAVQHRVRRHG